MQRSGFSLLELSIVLTILAVVVAGGLTLGTAKVQQDDIANTYAEMEDIEKALKVFLNENGRLPCPASITLARSDPLFGREATDCADASPPAGITLVEYPAASGEYVRIGGVPFYSLEMPDKYLEDAWQGRYLYAVHEDAITALTSSSTGNITVNDESGTSISDAIVAVIVSHGKSHKGAYSGKAGALFSACDATNQDRENCDADGVFTDAVYNDGSTAANFYDDLIIWKTRASMFETVNTAGSGFKPWDLGSGKPTSNYPLEIKGVTPATYASNLGLAAYNTACSAAFANSWVLRSSDLPYLEGLPTGLTNGRFVIDSCNGDTGTGIGFADADYCFITPNIRLRVSPSGASGLYTNTRATLNAMNCSNWSVTSAVDVAGVLLTTTAAITPDNFRSSTIVSNNTTYTSQSHAGTSFTVSTDDCSTSRAFICVGEK